MKRIFLLLLVAFSIASVASAQTIKFGRVNTQEIIELMPEADSALMKIATHQKTLEEQFNSMQEELNIKYRALEKDAPNLQGVIAEQRKKDVMDLRDKLESFSQGAEQEIQKIRSMLIAPILKKVQDSVDKVAKLNLITFVIDEASQMPAFVYMDMAAVKDLNPLIKAELKLKDKKPAAK